MCCSYSSRRRFEKEERRRRKKIKRTAEESKRRRTTTVGQNVPTNSGKQERALPLNTLAGAGRLLRCQASTSSRKPPHRALPTASPHVRANNNRATLSEEVRWSLPLFSSPASHAPLFLPERERVWRSQISCQQRRPLGDFGRRQGAFALLLASPSMPCDGPLC